MPKNNKAQKLKHKLNNAVFEAKILDFSQEEKTIAYKSHSRKFFQSREWLDLKDQVLATHPLICVYCKTDVDVYISHIFPRKQYPQLALSIQNLQPLCKECVIVKDKNFRISIKRHNTV